MSASNHWNRVQQTCGLSAFDQVDTFHLQWRLIEVEGEVSIVLLWLVLDATGWSVSKYMPSSLLNNLLFCLVISGWSFKVEMKRHQWMILKLFHTFQWDNVLISLFKSSNLCGRRWEERDAEAFLRMFKNFEAFGLSTNLVQTRKQEKTNVKKTCCNCKFPTKTDHVQLLNMFGNTCILKTSNPRKDMRFIKKKTS